LFHLAKNKTATMLGLMF